MKTRLDHEERELLKSVERGEWRSAASSKAVLKRYTDVTGTPQPDPARRAGDEDGLH